MDSNMIMLELESNMNKTIESLIKKFASVQAGRANPSLLDGINVMYYGNLTPLKQVGNISVPEARQLLIKPFDKSCLKDIEKAIIVANIGLTPSNDGETIRLIIPELTEQRRKELAKQTKAIAEDAKVSIRNNRHEALSEMKKAEFSDDISKGLEKDIQDIVNKFNKNVEDLFKEKEKELLSI